MPNPPWFTVLTLMPIYLLAGCAGIGAGSQATAKTEPVRTKATAPSQPRLMLNEGYSMLYKDAGSLDLTELILYVKAESDSFEAAVASIAQFGDELKQQLEQIAREYPGVRIDLDPLPEIEKRKRTAIAKDRARYFAPIVGRGGVEYERTVLIGYVNGINHERHLCQVMAEAEPNSNLKKFLLDTEKRYDDLYKRVNALLEKRYFRSVNNPDRD